MSNHMFSIGDVVYLKDHYRFTEGGRYYTVQNYSYDKMWDKHTVRLEDEKGEVSLWLDAESCVLVKKSCENDLVNISFVATDSSGDEKEIRAKLSKDKVELIKDIIASSNWF